MLPGKTDSNYQCNYPQRIPQPTTPRGNMNSGPKLTLFALRSMDTDGLTDWSPSPTTISQPAHCDPYSIQCSTMLHVRSHRPCDTRRSPTLLIPYSIFNYVFTIHTYWRSKAAANGPIGSTNLVLEAPASHSEVVVRLPFGECTGSNNLG